MDDMGIVSVETIDCMGGEDPGSRCMSSIEGNGLSLFYMDIC
jgi:hypothetical protein